MGDLNIFSDVWNLGIRLLFISYNRIDLVGVGEFLPTGAWIFGVVPQSFNINWPWYVYINEAPGTVVLAGASLFI